MIHRYCYLWKEFFLISSLSPLYHCVLQRHLYEHDVRVPFVVRGPKTLVSAENCTLDGTIVSTIDISPTILDIVLESLETATNNETTANESVPLSLRSAMKQMDGLSFWKFLKAIPNHDQESLVNDPFVQRTDLLISYHGEGDPKCGLSECPAPLNGLWWMPDSYNNTYHCVRTLHEEEDSIYCVFYDDEDFVEYYDLQTNPHQLGNDYECLSDTQVAHYEQRLQELLS